MGVKVAQVRVACNTGTGTQDITTSDLGGLTPKAAIFIASRAVSDDTAADGSGFYSGMTDGTRSLTTTTEDQHAQTSSNSAGDGSESYCLLINDGTASETIEGTATFSSWITNGVTINWTDAPGSAFLLTVIFFAGTDLSVYVGRNDLGNTLDLTTDITSPGFEPDVVIAAARSMTLWYPLR